jgi:hypothetical protein
MFFALSSKLGRTADRGSVSLGRMRFPRLTPPAFYQPWKPAEVSCKTCKLTAG